MTRIRCRASKYESIEDQALARKWLRLRLQVAKVEFLGQAGDECMDSFGSLNPLQPSSS